MNGHHADCSCQSCTIGREIGMDRALELIERMRAALLKAQELARVGLLSAPDGLTAAVSDWRRVALEESAAFLSEHAEHE